jgi:hypothetical protein
MAGAPVHVGLSIVGNPQAIAWIAGILALIGLGWWGIRRFFQK